MNEFTHTTAIHTIHTKLRWVCSPNAHTSAIQADSIHLSNKFKLINFEKKLNE